MIRYADELIGRLVRDLDALGIRLIGFRDLEAAGLGAAVDRRLPWHGS